MAMYAMSFSLASIFSHNTGMQMFDKFGYEFTWYFMTAFAVLGVGILVILLKILQKKATKAKVSLQS
ncbi:hypothetical protein KO506_03395 [Polaribacter vadi]|uniref:hypothetical protein n=1 Tax=Polaribacter TaxID=52959 RepID=UPI001C0A2491|nr:MULTISPECIES: hypothetical protein [Polaribacter]MBU3010433.1 hypothetical protein [Polaribacter vadi]MDO6740241.1 hypothetical protein [Polaribacter sp. 1_MG-2023]